MSRVDWLVTLRDVFHHLQEDGVVGQEQFLRRLNNMGLDLVPISIYEVSHAIHEKGYTRSEMLSKLREGLPQERPVLTLD